MSLLISLELQRPNFTLSVNTAIDTATDNKGFTAIYGHSGAGKTTLLRWIAGLETTCSGHLTFNQHIWQDEKTFVPTHRRQIAYVFQDARLFPHLSVLANLEYAYQRRFNDQGPSLQQVCQWFELEPLLNSNSCQLSGGEQQRVAMARALLSSPQLVMMDEPLGALDSQSREHILCHLETLHRQLPVPVLYVSHNLEEVNRLADQLLLIESGTLVAQGRLLDLCTRLNLSLSHEENAASIIEATIEQHDSDYFLTRLAIDNKLPLFLTHTDSKVGEKVRVRIPARDISITLQRPEQTSILNILPACIDEIEICSGARVLLRLRVANQYLLVRLTRKSVDQLQLKPGLNVYAQIKTVALLREQPQP